MPLLEPGQVYPDSILYTDKYSIGIGGAYKLNFNNEINWTYNGEYNKYFHPDEMKAAQNFINHVLKFKSFI